MPYFLEESRKEEIVEVAENKQLDGYFTGITSGMSDEEIMEEKKAFLVQCMNADINQEAFFQNVYNNSINWNPYNSDEMNVLSQVYLFENPNDEKMQENGQFYMTKSYLDQASQKDPEYKKLLDDVLKNFSCQQIWDSREQLKKAFLGVQLEPVYDPQMNETEPEFEKKLMSYRLESVQAFNSVKKDVNTLRSGIKIDEIVKEDNKEIDNINEIEDVKEINNINEIEDNKEINNIIEIEDNKEINNINEIEDNKEINNINDIDSKTEIDKKNVIKEKPKKKDNLNKKFRIEDTVNNSFNVERIVPENGASKLDMIYRFTNKNTSKEEKRNLLMSIIFFDLSDEKFKDTINKIQNNPQAKSFLDDVAKEGDTDYFFDGNDTGIKFGKRIIKALDDNMSLIKCINDFEVKKAEINKNIDENGNYFEENDVEIEKPEINNVLKEAYFQNEFNKLSIKKVEFKEEDKKAELKAKLADSKVDLDTKGSYFFSYIFSDKKDEDLLKYAKEIEKNQQSKNLLHKIATVGKSKNFDALLNDINFINSVKSFLSNDGISLSSGVRADKLINGFVEKNSDELSEDITGNKLFPYYSKNMELNKKIMQDNKDDTDSEYDEEIDDSKDDIKIKNDDKEKKDNKPEEGIINTDSNNLIENEELNSSHGSIESNNIIKTKSSKKRSDSIISINEEPQLLINPEKIDPNISGYTNALKDFNTKRLLTKKESKKHQRLRKAAETMVNMRKEAAGKAGDHGNRDVIWVRFNNLKNDKEAQKNYACKWLENVNEMKYHAYIYTSRRSPLTFAGSDRLRGAQSLQRIADKELMECENSINALGDNKKYGINLKELYNNIAYSKLLKARDVLDNGINYGLQTVKEQRKTLKAITESLAAVVANNAVGADNADSSKVNFYTVLKKMNDSPMLNQALVNLIQSDTNGMKIKELMDSENLNNEKGIPRYLKKCGINLAKDFIPEQKKQKVNKIHNDKGGRSSSM